MKEITRKVVSYCEIPEEISEKYSRFEETHPDCYIPWKITPLSERGKYSDNWDFENWVMKEYPEIKEGEEILIDIDY